MTGGYVSSASMKGQAAEEDCVLIEFSELADFIAMEKGLGRSGE